jgi:hypothetical protein
MYLVTANIVDGDKTGVQRMQSMLPVPAHLVSVIINSEEYHVSDL